MPSSKSTPAKKENHFKNVLIAGRAGIIPVIRRLRQENPKVEAT